MKRIGLLTLAAAAAVVSAAVFGPAGHAYAAGFSYAYVAPPKVGDPGEYTATLYAVASVDGPLSVTVTPLEGTTIDRAGNCALTVTALDCLIDAVAGAPVTVDLSGTYTGKVIHLRTAGEDAAGPVSFQADTRFRVVRSGDPAPIPTPGPTQPTPPVQAPPTFPVPPILTPPTFPVPTPPVFTPPTPPTPPVINPPVIVPPTPPVITPPTPPVFTPPTFPVLNPPVGAPTPITPPIETVILRHTLDRQRAKVLAYVNKHRAEAGAPALRLVPDLNRSAQRYAGRLAGDGVFSHTDGSVLTQRVEATGYRFHFVGENLGLGQASPWRIVHDWMHSPEHRDNMLDPRFADAGIGLAIRTDGQIVWCLHLGEPA